jgi:hypothetical protein
MAKDRVRLKMSWTVAAAQPLLPFSDVSDFEKHAQASLVRPFAHSYNPELTMTVTEDYGPEMFVMELIWDVDLDGVAGNLHEPTDHAKHAQYHLVDGIKMFGRRLKVEILRFPDEDDVDGATDLVAWDEGFRERRYAAFKKRMDEEFPVQAA